jgi:branched-chain amino acid transport system ATP-binding protein
MSVLENLLMARHTFGHYNLLDNILIYGRAMRVGVENRRFCEEIIDFMELEPYRKALVGDLPYGVRKRVEVARALALSPKLLLLDEPMAGMTLEEKEDMVRFILDIRAERGTTIILIEHDLGVVMDISERVYVLDFGQVIASGLPEEVSQNPRVQEAYVGVDHVA